MPHESREPARRSRRVGRRGRQSWQALRWWGEGIVIVGMCLLIAAAHLATNGLTLAVIPPLGWGAVYVLLRLEVRWEYRRGFRHGYESATRTVLQRALGQTPGMDVRATIDGDQTPEPWHAHTAIAPTQLGKP